MIHESLVELRNLDDRIRLLNEMIDDARGLKAWMPRGVPSSGIGNPTEEQAIRLSGLREELSKTCKARLQLCKMLKEEKNKIADDILWELMWDHFYRGYSWMKTAEKHNMKESAVKMRFSRFLKQREAAMPPVQEHQRRSCRAAHRR